jgi:hypothetical protein
MLEELLPTEELEIGIFDSAVTQRLIAQVVHVFEKRQALSDPIQPGTEQILLPGLSSLPRSHRSTIPRSSQGQGITASDSKESQKTICKKTTAPLPKSGKNYYFETLNRASHSTAWKYFTGDDVESAGRQ